MADREFHLDVMHDIQKCSEFSKLTILCNRFLRSMIGNGFVETNLEKTILRRNSCTGARESQNKALPNNKKTDIMFIAKSINR